MSDRVAVAIVHDDPPRVFMAEDQDTLHWVLALHLIAATPSERFPRHLVRAFRSALVEERWADAVVAWIDHHDVAVDVYSSETLYLASDVEMGEHELQFTPLFQD